MKYRARAGMPVCDGSVLQSASLKFLNVQTVLRKDHLFARSLARSMMNSPNLRSFSHLVINLLEITPSGQTGKAPVEAVVHVDGGSQNTASRVRVCSFLRFPLCRKIKLEVAKYPKSSFETCKLT